MMSIHRYVGGVLFGLLLFSVSGCAWQQNYGKLRLQPYGKDRLTIENLLDNWTGYHIYYAGLEVYRPSALMFDPKEGERKLVPHEWWIKVEDKKTLIEIVDWLNFDKHFEPLIWRILGPNDAFFGYVYTAWTHVLIRVIDEKTLWVDDMSKPPDYPAGGTMEAGVSGL
jgi:hypothetical protein